MLTLGGDHFISYPLLKAHAELYGPIALLQFDAHCDTWADDGIRFDHGTMFSRAVSEGLIKVENKEYDEFHVFTRPGHHVGIAYTSGMQYKGGIWNNDNKQSMVVSERHSNE